jgi:hypothetical protein
LLENQQKLLDVVHQVSQGLAGPLRIAVPARHQSDELRLDPAQYAGHVIEVDFDDVGELHEHFELVSGGLGDFHCGLLLGVFLDELDDGALDVVPGEAAGTAVHDDVAPAGVQLGVLLLLLDAALLNVDDRALPALVDRLTAERHNH